VNAYQEAVERYVRHNAGHGNRRSSRKNPGTSGFVGMAKKDICYANRVVFAFNSESTSGCTQSPIKVQESPILVQQKNVLN
jgi:hypothetical protein